MELKDYLQIFWKKRWIVLGAFVSTILATVVFTFSQTPTYRARATFVVTPTGAYEDLRSLVDVVDTLSRRTEIAGTYAEVATSRLIKQQAADGLGLSNALRKNLSVDSKLLPNTNVLQITVEGRDPELVRLFANTVGAKTIAYVQGLYEAYGLRTLDIATSPTEPVKPRKLFNLAVGAILGLGLGVVLAFLAHYLEPSPEQRPSAGAPAQALTNDVESRGEEKKEPIKEPQDDPANPHLSHSTAG